MMVGELQLRYGDKTMKTASKVNSKAVAILRISSLRQEENTSHALQEKETRRYCEATGLDLVRTERIIESAKNSELRKKYRAIFDWAIKTGIKHVVFYKYDRETRNLTDAERTEALARNGIVKIHYVADRKVFDENTPDSEYLNRDLHAVISKNYVRDLSTKVNSAMKAKAESGWFPSNHVPLGYTTQRLKNDSGRDRKTGSIVIRDPDTRKVKQVQREFELRASGLSIDRIRDQIVKEGFISPEQISKYRKSAIHYRLTDPFYYGYFRWQGTVYKGNHEIIIPTQVLDQVRRNSGKRGQGKRSKGVFGGGWLKCAKPDCGCVIIFDPKTKLIKETGKERVFPYYHCTNGKKAHTTMKGMNVSEEALWTQFGQAIEGITIPKELAEDIAQAMNETQEKARAAIKKQMADYREALKAIESEEDNLYRDFKRGLIPSEDSYRRQLKHVRNERLRFTHLLEQAQLQLNDAVLETAQSILELAMNAKSRWLKLEASERRSMLDKILSNPTLDGVTVRYEMKKPFAIVSRMASSSNWWANGRPTPSLFPPQKS